jgi:hypothetical protein
MECAAGDEGARPVLRERSVKPAWFAFSTQSLRMDAVSSSADCRLKQAGKESRNILGAIGLFVVAIIVDRMQDQPLGVLSHQVVHACS